MTTLSQQLKRLAVPQTQIYRPGIKRASFLFEPNEAAGLDKETVFALGKSLCLKTLKINVRTKQIFNEFVTYSFFKDRPVLMNYK